MNIKKFVCAGLAASILAASVIGCYGSFGLTKTVHGIGSGIARSNKWVGGLVYLILGGPVAGITLFGDFVIFNLLEFWLGVKVFAMNEFEHTDELGRTVLASKNADGSLSVKTTDVDGSVSEYVLELADANTVRILDAAGMELALHHVAD